MSEHYKSFSHRDCEYYPCHPGADPENFNCLFCYCPFYMLGDRCGGNFTYTEKGVKNCTNCLFPHKKENYDRIIQRYGEIQRAMTFRKQEKQKDCLDTGKVCK